MRNQLLRDSDWASMAHSLEIRVPLVDVTLLRAVAPLLVRADRPTKRDMADAPRQKLPPGILNRDKTGFRIPVREWLMTANPQSAMASPARTNPKSAERGLRGWARCVYSRFAKN
jgi:asparagine synthase (glutamine-hydrolysing)